MKTFIITDSTSEISQNTARENDIYVIPMNVTFDGKTYFDGVDIFHEEFYIKLEEAETLPTTTQITPHRFREIFENILKDPEAEIFGLFLSSKLSGTYNSARIAVDELETDRVYLTDSLTVSGGLGLLVFIANDLRKRGFGARKIKSHIDRLVPRLEMMMCLTTLKYLKAGGRISSVSATMGNLLKILPVAKIDKGEIISIGKLRGKGTAMDFIFSKVDLLPADPDYPVSFMHAENEEMCEKMISRYKSAYPIENALVFSMGPVVGTYSGPGCFGIAYIANLN